MKLALVQMRMDQEREKNIEKALSFIRKASNDGANIVCLPELFDSRYFPQTPRKKEEDERSNAIDYLTEKIPGETTRVLSESARENRIVLIGGSIFERGVKGAYNTSVVFDDTGKMIGKYRKVHIPNDESFYEQDYFQPGSSYPVFNTKFGRLGVLICFDQWYPEAARMMRLKGAEMIFYPTAIGRVKGIEEKEGDWRSSWEAVQRGHAIANSVVVASVNRVGKEGHMNFWGGSFVYDQFGTLLARGGSKEEEVLHADVDLSLQAEVEEGWGFLRNRKPETYSKISK